MAKNGVTFYRLAYVPVYFPDGIITCGNCWMKRWDGAGYRCFRSNEPIYDASSRGHECKLIIIDENEEEVKDGSQI